MYMDIVTICGIIAVFFYSLMQIFSFYGINSSVYGPYLLFYLFIAVNVIILPHRFSNP